MEFYFGITSGNSLRTAFALREIGLPHTAHALHVPRGDSRTPDYLTVNPMGKVPALVDDGLVLWESNAINWYLAEKQPRAGLLAPSLAGRARIQRWLFFQTGHVTPACRAVYLQTNAQVQDFWGLRSDAESAEAGRAELRRYLLVLEAALAGREWLEGEFSLADIAYAPHLWMVAQGGFDFSAFPAVQAWLDRMQSRAAFQASVAMIFGK